MKPVVRRQINRPITTPTVQKYKKPKYETLFQSGTEPMDGHKTLILETKKLENVFDEPEDVDDIEVEPMPALKAKNPFNIVSFPEKVSKKDIKEGKWKVDSMKNLIFASGLKYPADMSKEGLIKYILDNSREFF